MDPMALGLLKLLHILFTATWFGAGLTFAGDIRRTLEKGSPHTELLVDRVKRALAITGGSGVMTIVTGFVLIFALGGFGAVPPRIHAGLSLSLVLLAVNLAGLRPTWAKIADLVKSGSDAGEARKLAGRMAMLSGVSHLLWLVVLILMVLPIGG